jgi:hypothetical protein
LITFLTAHEAGIVSLEVSCDGDVISDAVIFEYKSDTTHKSPPNETLGVDATNGTSNVANETSDIPSETGDFESDEDSLSLVWECGNVCNSYLCETETCRKTLRSTLLQRFQDLTTKLCEGDSRSKENENKVKHHPNPLKTRLTSQGFRTFSSVFGWHLKTETFFVPRPILLFQN